MINKEEFEKLFEPKLKNITLAIDNFMKTINGLPNSVAYSSILTIFECFLENIPKEDRKYVSKDLLQSIMDIIAEVNKARSVKNEL
jgi:hypothetical protein